MYPVSQLAGTESMNRSFASKISGPAASIPNQSARCCHNAPQYPCAQPLQQGTPQAKRARPRTKPCSRRQRRTQWHSSRADRCFPLARCQQRGTAAVASSQILQTWVILGFCGNPCVNLSLQARSQSRHGGTGADGKFEGLPGGPRCAIDFVRSMAIMS